MTLLSRLLGGRASPLEPLAEATAEHIARALSGAGLDHGTDPAGVRATIDRALASAGLRRGHDDAPAVDGSASVHLERVDPPTGHAAPARGRFLRAAHDSAHGRRDFRLYLPVSHDESGPECPLIVMLHGCTQTVEDFAVGTRMNALADRHGFLVAYPQQIAQANQARCWNWFRPEDQRADAGEPAILAGIVAQVAQAHRVDAGRVFVAGLSAGAAMAVVLGRTRPDLVRAIGVHSGLPYASAHDVPSAFAAMQGRGSAPTGAHANGPAVPMIVFHGDADRTVAPSNAEALAATAVVPGQHMRTETGRVPGGQAWIRQRVEDAAGRPCFERWTVHGAGHAWSGGDPAGSYTDPAGPDASSAMVDFFLGLDAVQRDNPGAG